jgi:predicted metalloprotease with PDZ domain
VNYYNKGEVVGFLLDLEIRGATKNQKSLDDVMRYLWENYYKKGRGYTNEDVEKAVSQIAGKSFSTFFARYVNGVDEIDYNAFLKNAGWKLEPGDTAAQFRIVEIEGASNEQKAVRAGLIAVPAKAQGAAR